MYASLSDMFVYFRADELAQRAAPEHPEVTGSTLLDALNDPSSYMEDDPDIVALNRIERALEDATAMMDSYLVQRYTLPVVSEALRRPCAELARCRLFTEGMSDAQRTACEDIKGWLHSIALGNLSLPSNDDGRRTVPIMRV